MNAENFSLSGLCEKIWKDKYHYEEFFLEKKSI